MKILIADDNEFNILIAKKYINKLFPETQIETCTDGVEAVKFSTLSKFDLILMDLQMPNMDGETATKAIRNNADNINQQTPILALTASVNPSELDNCMQIGMNDVIAKPFVANNIKQKIQSFAVAV